MIVPIASPFHERTSALCTSMRWKEWAGYYAVSSYDTCHSSEYYAFRNAAGLIDVTPLFKYEVTGKDAAAFLARVIAKDITRLQINQVTYCCWCDGDGKIVDDGTVTRLDENSFRLTAAEPSLRWFHKFTRGFSVKIEDSTEKIAALAIQGPTSRDILKQICSADLDGLKFFRACKTKSSTGFDMTITRTGYTGDLGYEVWVDNQDALALWDLLINEGRAYRLQAAGLDALDVTRVEAGFIMNGVDYFSANHCLIDSRKSSPYEAGLGWTVNLDRDVFNGQAALKREKEQVSPWGFAGLIMDWNEIEAHFNAKGLPPQVCSNAWRTAIPIYASSGKQVGYATSGSWSPILKQNLALATLQTEHSKIGEKLQIELTVEFERKTVTATVSKTPFFNPERKCSCITTTNQKKGQQAA